jgi:hypothetical protein
MQRLDSNILLFQNYLAFFIEITIIAKIATANKATTSPIGIIP